MFIYKSDFAASLMSAWQQAKEMGMKLLANNNLLWSVSPKDLEYSMSCMDYFK